MELGQPSWHIWVWIEKSYTLCHCIARSFLLQTTLNSISKRFSKYQNRVYLFRIRRGTTLGPWDKLSFKKPCIMWTDFTNCACKKVKKKIPDRFSILWKQFFFRNYPFGIIWKSPHFFHHFSWSLFYTVAKFLYDVEKNPHVKFLFLSV